MKFEEDMHAQASFKELVGGPPMRFFTAYAGDWQFVVTYDTLHNNWAATYQPRHPQGPVSAQSCEPPPEGKTFLNYPTQTLAEIACVKKYRQLRKAN